MAKRDGSEAWHEFQAAFVRKLEIAEEQGEIVGVDYRMFICG